MMCFNVAFAGPLVRESRTSLYERARQLDIAGRSRMSKKELIRAIRKAS